MSAIEIYEVHKVVRREISLARGLAMADALVYATAQRHGAQLITADADFEGLPETVVIR